MFSNHYIRYVLATVALSGLLLFGSLFYSSVTQVNAQSDAGVTDLSAVNSADAVLLEGVVIGQEARVLVQLLDDANRVVAETVSEAGGFYTFDAVPPAANSLRVLDLERAVLPLAKDVVLDSEQLEQFYTLQTEPQAPVEQIVGEEIAVEAKLYVYGETSLAEAGLRVELVTKLGYGVARAFTDARGRFVMPPVPDGEYWFELFSAENEQLHLIDHLTVKERTAFKPFLLRPAVNQAGELVTAYEAVTTQERLFPLTASEREPAGGDGAISGNVTSLHDGQPMDSVAVDVYTVQGSLVGYTYTNSAGDYRVDSLSDGDYVLSFDGSGFEHYPTQYYAGVYQFDEATSVGVVGGATVDNIDIVLNRGATVIGKVTAEDTGLPLANTEVRIYTASNSWTNITYTDSDGNYQLRNVASNVTLRFEPDDPPPDYDSPYMTEFYNDKPDFDSADFLTFTPETTTTVDAELGLGAEISGIVTAADTGAPLEGITVWAQLDVPVAGLIIIKDVTTEADGRYVISGLPAGRFFVSFHDYSFDRQYLSEHYDNQPAIQNATPITTSLNTVYPNINAALDKPGSISGIVTDATSGEPLENARVYAYRSDGGYYGQSVNTDSTGRYTVTNLPGEDIYLEFQPDYGSGHYSEYYDDVATLAEATPISVVLNEEVTGINAGLDRGGAIAGKVVGIDGNQPVSNVYVRLLHADTLTYANYSANSDADGNYEIVGIPDGEWVVEFDPSNSPYVGQYYDGQSDSAAATVVSTVLNTTVEDINATLDVGGIIAGTLSPYNARFGSALVNLEVFDQDNQLVYDISRQIDQSGNYEIRGLLSGSYKVKYTPNQYDSLGEDGYVFEYYNDKRTLAEADLIPAQINQVTGDIDVVFDLGGEINGTVTGFDTNSGVEYVTVYVRDADGAYVRETMTEPDGTYSVNGLATGTYKLQFEPDYDSPYLPAYYNGQDNIDDATPVSITLGQTVNNLDVVLDLGGTLSGQITASDTGQPVTNVEVTLSAAGSFVDFVFVSSQGNYQFEGLPSGDYVVGVFPNNTYLSEYYDNKRTQETATRVQVTPNQSVTGIDIALDVGGVITGVVTADDTGEPLSGVSVDIVGVLGNGAYTDQNGRYRLERIQPGLVSVVFSTDSANAPAAFYLGEYYDDAVDPAEAATIDVAIGQTIGNVNASLQRESVLEGYVTAADTGNGLRYITVIAYDSDGSYLGETDTSADGYYYIGNLRAQDVRLGALRQTYSESYESINYLGEYYENAESLADATVIALPASSTVTVDFELERGATIVGTIASSAADQPPLSEVKVAAYSADSDRYTIGRAYVGSDGSYRLRGLPADSYVLSFELPYPFIDEYYDQASFFDDAAPIAVSANTTTTVDYTLRVNKTLTVAVTDEDSGEPIQGVFLALYRETDCAGQRDYVGTAFTDRDGIFRYEGLPAGGYELTAEKNTSQAGVQTYVRQVEQVSISAESSNVQYDINMQKGGRLEGTVQAADAVALSYIRVDAYRTSAETGELERYQRIVTNPTDGSYRFSALPAGDYYLHFSLELSAYSNLDEPTLWYLDSYSGDKSSLDEASPIAVTAEGTSDYDATLERGGRISGSITDATTQNRVSTAVRVFTLDGEQQIYAIQNDFDGDYATPALRDGQYLIKFDTFNHGDAYYDGADDAASATPVAVTAGAMTTGIDASLEEGGSFGGRVFSEDRNELGNVKVSLYDEAGTEIASTMTGNGSKDRGSYFFGGLPAGTYFVMFHAAAVPQSVLGLCGDGYVRFAGEYHENAPNFATATPIEVNVGDSLYSITYLEQGETIVLPPNGSLQSVSGVVRDSSAQPVAGARVVSQSGVQVETNAAGRYTMQLISGEHTLKAYKFGYDFEQSVGVINIADVPVTNDFLGTIQQGSAQFVGTVAANARAVSNVWVSLYHLDETGWAVAAQTQSDDNGNYRLSDLPSGEYRLQFTDPLSRYPVTYNGAANTIDQAAPIAVADGATVVLNQNLQPLTPLFEVDRGPFAMQGGMQIVFVPADSSVVVPSGAYTYTFSAESTCPSGSPTQVQLSIGGQLLAMTQADGDRYTVAVDFTRYAQDRYSEVGWTMWLSVQTTCGTQTASQLVGGLAAYMPMGKVLDAATNEAVENAAVTLHRVAGAMPDADGVTNDCRTAATRPAASGQPFGDWSGLDSAEISAGHIANGVADHAAFMQPVVSQGQQLTGENGSYGWFLGSGCWYVVVEADGYDTLVSPLFSPLPNEQIEGLDLYLGFQADDSHSIFLPVITQP